MKQSRRMSLVEAITNVAVGYGVAVATQAIVFPLFGLRASLADNLTIGAVFDRPIVRIAAHVRGDPRAARRRAR